MIDIIELIKVLLIMDLIFSNEKMSIKFIINWWEKNIINKKPNFWKKLVLLIYSDVFLTWLTSKYPKINFTT